MLCRGKFLENDFRHEKDTVDHIIDNVYLGSCKSALEVVEGRPDIKYILNLSQYTLQAPEKIILKLKIDDHPKFQIEQFFDVAHRFIDEAKQNNSGVLIHCFAGFSRSPTIVISYLMKYHNMSFEDAYTYVSNKRVVCPNPGFIEKLKELSSKLICK